MVSQNGDDTRSKTLVLLAAYNGAETIERQISSVLAQDDVDIEILVRDDGSKDGTDDIVANLARQDPRVRLISDGRASGSAGANFFELIRIAPLSGCDFVAFCDQDDVWHSGKLSRAIHHLRTRGADGYSSAVEAVWPDGRRRTLRQNPQLRAADHLFEGAGQGCTFVMTVGFVLRVRAALAAHPQAFARLHYHDWAVFALARASGCNWIIDDAVTMTYLQHEANDTGARGSMGSIRRRWSLIAGGWYRGQILAMVDMLLLARPGDPAASQWRALSTRKHAWIAFAQRLHFVLVNGRRKRIDRCVMAAAVLLGHL
ncbi:MAG: glycosyltransferase [Burkholderiaceae bacterium]|nr:glycosyltransferase [Burkholderiaceae bacterium]